MGSRLIYIAGPLYTPSQKKYLKEIASRIEKADDGVPTFLPHRDLGMAGEDMDASEIFHRNIEKLDEADVVVGVLNGFDVDGGTAFELGYAYAKGKALLGLVEDARVPEKLSAPGDTDMNLMIKVPVKITRSIAELLASLRDTNIKDADD